MGEPTLGQIAFEAYSLATGGKTWDGKDIPPFLELGGKVQAAWEAAAIAVQVELKRLIHAGFGTGG